MSRATASAGRRTGHLVSVVLLAVVAAGLGACGSSSPGAQTKGDTVPVQAAVARPRPKLPVTVTDADGHDVVVTDVSRIVTLWTNISEVVYSLGLGDDIVGRDVSTTFPPLDRLPAVTRGHDLSAEALLSLKPTLVLADDESGPPEALDQVRAAGIPVVTFARASSVAEIAQDIRAVARAVGLAGEGTRLAAHTQAEVRKVQRAIPAGRKPKVAFLYMRGNAGVYLIGGKGSGADSMIDAAGGVDAGTAMGLDAPFTPITSEALVQAAPDIILMTTSGLASVGGMEGLLKVPGVAQTPAAASRQVVTEDDGVLYSFGSRTPEALRTLIADFHPKDGS